MAEYIEIQTTIDSPEGAQRIAEALVSPHLAACVQISGPITSVYWWKGTLERSTEWQCTVKARKEVYDQIEQVILALHPYETPEIIAVDISAGSSRYLEWISRETMTSR
ncbi:MAG: divalent-cation tolerance protein CutA [Ktedonobacterales bacterium]